MKIGTHANGIFTCSSCDVIIAPVTQIPGESDGTLDTGAITRHFRESHSLSFAGIDLRSIGEVSVIEAWRLVEQTVKEWRLVSDPAADRAMRQVAETTLSYGFGPSDDAQCYLRRRS